ncbi:hypothetical protein EGH67_16940 [Klebsiella aerogenes]|nr:hypothetical protein OA41_03275 [Klebsiella aerogenes]KTI28817.1 hypothetical protein ASV09_15590 [Klebsiella aerogenes]KVJ80751.1 hypothetical protein AWS23_12445 [Klebsiella aerogenes]RSV63316.1 hypothetical protein EGH60_26310 [Klebsiella aerogenes]RSW50676.1 hypothetical protein EGH67_16940 [Klebsiella aerogenes]
MRTDCFYITFRGAVRAGWSMCKSALMFCSPLFGEEALVMEFYCLKRAKNNSYGIIYIIANVTISLNYILLSVFISKHK